MSAVKVGMRGYPVGLQIVVGAQAKPPAPSSEPGHIMIDGKPFIVRGDKAYDENGREYEIDVVIGGRYGA